MKYRRYYRTTAFGERIALNFLHNLWVNFVRMWR